MNKGQQLVVFYEVGFMTLRIFGPPSDLPRPLQVRQGSSTDTPILFNPSSSCLGSKTRDCPLPWVWECGQEHCTVSPSRCGSEIRPYTRRWSLSERTRPDWRTLREGTSTDRHIGTHSTWVRDPKSETWRDLYFRNEVDTLSSCLQGYLPTTQTPEENITYFVFIGCSNPTPTGQTSFFERPHYYRTPETSLQRLSTNKTGRNQPKCPLVIVI